MITKVGMAGSVLALGWIGCGADPTQSTAGFGMTIYKDYAGALAQRVR